MSSNTKIKIAQLGRDAKPCHSQRLKIVIPKPPTTERSDIFISLYP